MNEIAEYIYDLCKISMPAGGLVEYYSWNDGYWNGCKPRQYLEKFYPDWLKANPKRDHPEDLIMILLGNGWEPFASSFSASGFSGRDAVTNHQNYYFRRKVAKVLR